METLESLPICRLCGQSSEVTLDIFDGKEFGHIAKISAVLPILVHKMDMLPKQICHRCSYKLEEFHKFYIGCLKTDKMLKSQLSWMRKNTTSPEVGEMPMVRIENAIVKSEPLESSLEDLSMSPIHPVFLKYTSRECSHCQSQHLKSDTLDPKISSSGENQIQQQQSLKERKKPLKKKVMRKDPDVAFVEDDPSQKGKLVLSKVLRSRQVLLDSNGKCTTAAKVTKTFTESEERNKTFLEPDEGSKRKLKVPSEEVQRKMRSRDLKQGMVVKKVRMEKLAGKAGISRMNIEGDVLAEPEVLMGKDIGERETNSASLSMARRIKVENGEAGDNVGTFRIKKEYHSPRNLRSHGTCLRNGKITFRRRKNLLGKF